MTDDAGKRELLMGKLAVKGFLSLKGFAELVHISYPTAHRYAKDGRINCIRVGGVHRVYMDEVERFMREGTLPKEGQDDNDESTDPLFSPPIIPTS